MAMNWNEYEIILLDESSKECEVTGREMGGEVVNSSGPISKLVPNTPINWSNHYGGYGSVEVKFLGTENDGVVLDIYNGYHAKHTLHLGDEWTSGWNSFGTWDYFVTIYIQKIGV